MEIITGAAVLLVAFCLYKTYHHFLDKNLHTKVSWCVAEGRASIRCESRLIDYLQLDLIEIDGISLRNTVDAPYRLNINDKIETDWLCLVLSEYQKELSKKFFDGQLTINYTLASLSVKEYFLLTLCSFMEKHECDISFCEHEMYTLLERKDYGSWGSRLYDATYALTPFGVMYNKLYLLVRSYCEQNNNKKASYTHKLVPILKERLDSGKIVISRV